MLTVGIVDVAVKNSVMNMPIKLQVINNPENFINVEFINAEVVDGCLVISAEINEEEDE